jgi:hypothetical protein
MHTVTPILMPIPTPTVIRIMAESMADIGVAAGVVMVAATMVDVATTVVADMVATAADTVEALFEAEAAVDSTAALGVVADAVSPVG